MSEFKCISYLKNANLFVDSDAYALDARNYEVTHQPGQRIQLKLGLHVMQVMNLTDFFSKLFAIRIFLDRIMDSNKSLEGTDWISNILQTKFWETKVATLHLKSNEKALPLFVYFDDFEPLNALGAHSSAYKLSGSYCSYFSC